FVRILSLSAIFVIALSIPVGLFMQPAADTPLLRGDYAAFYTGGWIVLHGAGASLYDSVVQQRVQHLAWPAAGQSYFFFAYPPYVAVLFAPIAALGPGVGKAVYLLLLGLLLVPILRRLQRLADVPVPLIPLVAAVIAFAPLFHGWIGGQNSILSLLCFTMAVSLCTRPNFWSQFSGGMWIGVWLFKPQFSLPFIIFLAVGRRWTCVFGAAVVGIIYLTITAIVFPPDIVARWLEAATWFHAQDLALSAQQMVSLTGALVAVGQSFSAGPATISALTNAGYILSFILLGLVALRFHLATSHQRLTEAFLIGAPTVLLSSPHTVYYDLALLVAPAVLLWSRYKRPRLTGVIALLIAVAVCSALKGRIPVQPMIGLPLALFVLLAVRRPRQLAPEAAAPPRTIACPE
ncbi:MAG: DUF2029 domain-containing protein, partial [Bdellovibrionales bacterium]|nr:DUF2029 domain-containing protein [Bdellovibrionales bacterium]